MSKRRILQGLAVLAGVTLVSTAAFGLPWDLDMTDSQAVKGYEREMKGLPEGVVSQPSLLTPRGYAPNYKLTDPAVNGVQAPFPADAEVIADGERMYGLYCTPCHGDGIVIGPVGQPGRVPAVAILAGSNGVLQRRSDGWVYTTIRNGSLSKLMPPYGYAMTEKEMWSLVHYLRTMENGAYQAAPAAPAPQETPR